MGGLALDDVVKKLNEFSPESIAESWDNVGLLVEPYTKIIVKKILLTNDLTERVMDEAVNKMIDLIISYHPPIKQPLKTITQKTWRERVISRCLENKIALYSPHTCWDSMQNGVNDWLTRALPCKSTKVIRPNGTNPLIGPGRFCEVDGELTLRDAIRDIKTHTGHHNFLLGLASDSTLNAQIRTFAVCAGHGSEILKDVHADLFITGEMGHHDVLDANQNRTNVILLNHSNSERGYLEEFKENLDGILDGQVKIELSEKDKDPLKTVILHNEPSQSSD